MSESEARAEQRQKAPHGKQDLPFLPIWVSGHLITVTGFMDVRTYTKGPLRHLLNLPSVSERRDKRQEDAEDDKRTHPWLCGPSRFPRLLWGKR